MGITNYVDIGFRSLVPLAVRGGKASFDLVGSWQMNKNLLLKGKTGTAGSEAVLVFKSWWNVRVDALPTHFLTRSPSLVSPVSRRALSEILGHTARHQ